MTRTARRVLPDNEIIDLLDFYARGTMAANLGQVYYDVHAGRWKVRPGERAKLTAWCLETVRENVGKTLAYPVRPHSVLAQMLEAQG